MWVEKETRPQREKSNTRRPIVPGDADLVDSDDDTAPAVESDNVSRGMLWDDPDFPTPSSIKVAENDVLTRIEWLRPPVSTITVISVQKDHE